MRHGIDHGGNELGRFGRALGFTGGALLLLACACSSGADAGGSPPGETETTTAGVQLAALEVASITLESGNVVSWHELEPGLLLTRESFTYPSPPRLTAEGLDQKSLSAVDLYRRLAPDEAIPERLMAAFDRTQRLAFIDDSAPLELKEFQLDGSSISETAGGLGQARQTVVDDSACSWTWFEPNCNLCATGPCGDWRIRWPQITGDSSFSHKSTMTRASMCVYRGAVRHVFRLRGNDIEDTIQRAGQGTTFYLNNGSHGFTLGSRVLNAAGAGYHHCADSE
jgi:hypothetical protein